MRARTLMSVFAALALVAGAASAQDLVINEIYYDGPGTDTGTFTEILGPGGFDLTGYTLVGVNGNGGTEYATVLLDGYTIPADGYFVICEDSTLVEADAIDPLVDWQNGPDQVVLKDPTGYPIDSICYGYSEALVCEGGTNGPDVAGGSSISRCPDGTDTDDNEADTEETTPTPGMANECLGPIEPEEMSVCEVMELDADGFPVHFGTWVHLTSTVIVLNDDGTVGQGRIDCAVTDGECCTYLFDFNYYIELNEGDELDVTGTVDFYNGKVEITGLADGIEIISTGNPLPEPQNISAEELNVNGNDYESCLILIDHLSITGGDPWPEEGSNANVEVTDETGTVILRIDADTDIDGTEPPAEPLTVVGFSGQYDYESPYFEGFQIQPRKLADLYQDFTPTSTKSWGEIKDMFK